MPHRCYTFRVPTSRRRHTITETAPVENALNALRDETDQRVDLAELVVIGAEAKLAALRSARDAAVVGRRRVAQRVRNRDTGADPAAADAVRREGWVRP